MTDEDEPDHDDATPLDFDLEAAYRQALQAVEATDFPTGDAGLAQTADNPETADDPETAHDADPTGPGAADLLPFSRGVSASKPPEAAPAGSAGVDTAARVTPQQVLEAALFVGGVELTGERLAGLLKGESTPESVARLIHELNRRYTAENRPYQIVKADDAWHMNVRPDHEPLRRRVYGVGPKEIKLSQDALEILSLVAYRQPITRERIEELRENPAGPVLRQLVRRQIVAVQRTGDDLNYVTTARFLDVFGIASLDELPRAQDLNFK